MKTIDLHGIPLDLPEEHWLPQIRQQLPDYSENIGRLAAAVAGKYPGRGFIDIGANIGDTATIVLAHARLPILCIEGSEFYFAILKENIQRLNSDIELECALVDSSGGERFGELRVAYGTATFHPDSDGGAVGRFARLDAILERHPRFLFSKILKIDTDGMDGRILEGALPWISTAKPVLFWEHDIGRDLEAGGPGVGIFDLLLEAGYKSTLVFDNTGEFIEMVGLNARQQLADLSDYLPGGQEFYGYCDVCAFHAEDLDLCELVRSIELRRRQMRRKEGPKPLNEPLFRALVQAEFEVHGARVAYEAEQALKALLQAEFEVHGARVAYEAEQALKRCFDEIALVGQIRALNAQSQFDRYRAEVRVSDLETQVRLKDAELTKLQGMLREVLAEGFSKTRAEDARRQAEREELKALLAQAQRDYANAQHQLDSSIALRIARSLGRILAPFRRVLGGPGSAPQ